MIPRRFFWLFDTVTLAICFLLAYFSLSYLQRLILSGAPVGAEWVQTLSLPSQPSRTLPSISDLLWVLLSMTPITLVLLEVMGAYAPFIDQSFFSRMIAGTIGAPLGGLSVITLILFALKTPNWSRLFIFSFTVCASLGLLAYRGILRIFLLRRRAAGTYAKNVVLVGNKSGIEWILRYFASCVPVTAYRPIAYLRVDEFQPTPVAPSGEIKELGPVHELGNLLIHQPIHEVVAVHPVGGGDWIRQVIRDCDYFGVTLRIVPEALLGEEQRTLQVLYSGKTLHLPAVVLSSPHWDSEALFLKRLIDIVVSAALLVILFPLFVLIAIAIKIADPTLPVFYRWRVVGRNGVEFTGYKFTTMRSDADQLKSGLENRNEMVGPVFKIKDDPRTTRFGRFLRKYSLNELPQLWSVLKGDMSLVGPRPAFRHELERYEFWHKRKLSIEPGITCLWQIRGRNKIKHFDDWVRMDLEYIDNWSLWLDLKILIRTAWVVISGTGS